MNQFSLFFEVFTVFRSFAYFSKFCSFPDLAVLEPKTHRWRH